MPQLFEYDANPLIESELDGRLRAVSSLLEADMLALRGLMSSGLDDIVHRVMEDDEWRTKGREKIGIILTTDGGYVEVVHRIAETIRHHYSDVTFIVPDHAYSAGTILVMSGDQIFMDYYSRLGPIDPQVQTDGKFVPALGYLKQWERLLKKAEAGEITIAEIQLMLSFDQAELYMFEQARELSVELLKEWLAKYKFKNWTTTETRGDAVTDQMRSERAEEIARRLNETERWHSHGYGISLEVLQKEIQLKIEDYGTVPALKEAITSYHSLFEDFAHKNRLSGAIHVAGKFVPVSQE